MTLPGTVETFPDLEQRTDLSPDEFIALPALSPSGAKKILRAPAVYRWEKDNPKPSTDAMERGKAVHGLIFGHGDPVEILDFDSYRTKAAQQAKAEAVAAGRIPMLMADWENARHIVDAVNAHPLAKGLLRNGTPEQPWTWTTDGVPCKARTDWLTEVAGEQVIVDLKTSKSADPTEFRRSVATFGYHIQDAMCREGVEANTGAPAAFLFLVVEPDPPYLVSVVELDDEAKARGEELAARARAVYAQCVATGEWPGYLPTIHRVGLPIWALTDHEESA